MKVIMTIMLIKPLNTEQGVYQLKQRSFDVDRGICMMTIEAKKNKTYLRYDICEGVSQEYARLLRDPKNDCSTNFFPRTVHYIQL